MVRTRTVSALVSLLVLLAVAWGPLGRTAAAGERPALVVVIVVDQLAYEYLERFEKNFAEDGFFRTMAREGAWLTSGHHGHAFTFTAPGHATLLSGAYPRTTGIIANSWPPRWTTAKTAKDIYATLDPDAPLVEAQGRGVSPHFLLCDTLGDALRKSTGGKSKVVSLALKDRSAVLMGGRHPTAAYWFDDKNHKWTSSRYYLPGGKLPDYLASYNAANPAARYKKQSWTLLLDEKRYTKNYPDDAPYENSPYDLGRAFPHVLSDDDKVYQQLEATPLGNEMTLEVARLLLDQEHLGQGESPDLLCVSLSSNDYVGHSYGPHSLEVEDITYRTDRQLGLFLRDLKDRLQGRPLVVALSADHGVAPIPEYAADRGWGGKRNIYGKSGVELEEPVEKALAAAFGPAGEGRRYARIDAAMCQIYLDRDHPNLAKDEAFLRAQEIARDAVLAHPSVQSAVTRQELLTGGGSEREFYQAFARSFHRERSGDVLLAARKFQLPEDKRSYATTHGSPHAYDTHVPLIFWGAGVKAGRYDFSATTAHLAPTLARLLQISGPSDAEEPPLVQVLQ